MLHLYLRYNHKIRYKRIFSIGSMGITTYNPSTLDVTNKWEYSDFINVQPVNKSQLGSHEFTITMRKERKNDTMKFSSEHRSHLLTEALKYRNQFEKPKENLVSLYTFFILCTFLLFSFSLSFFFVHVHFLIACTLIILKYIVTQIGLCVLSLQPYGQYNVTIDIFDIIYVLLYVYKGIHTYKRERNEHKLHII